MYLKDGVRFIDEYLFTHILNRAAVGVDNSPGTFEYYTSQIGHGMWLWAALLPAALAAALLRARTDTREGRVRFMVALWAICGVAFFSLVQTKFHHYILPACPRSASSSRSSSTTCSPRRERLHPLYAALGIGIVLLVARDLMWEPERWIEMFVFRYDRPWPIGEPWSIDPSDGFLALGIVAAVAIAIAALPLAPRSASPRSAPPGSRSACGRSRSTCRSPASTGACATRCAPTTSSARSTARSSSTSARGELYDDWHDAERHAGRSRRSSPTRCRSASR